MIPSIITTLQFQLFQIFKLPDGMASLSDFQKKKLEHLNNLFYGMCPTYMYVKTVQIVGYRP